MDNKRKIGEEELKRALLMMKYDSRKTLTENVELVENKHQIDEQLGLLIRGLGSLLGKKAVKSAATGVAKKSFARRAGGFVADVAVTTALLSWIESFTGGGDTANKLEIFFEGCPATLSKITPTNSEQEIRSAADTIWENSVAQDFYEGFGSGNEEAIKSALQSMKTVSDLCSLSGVFYDIYGTTLLEALKSEIVGDDLITYAWVPINDKAKQAEAELIKLQQEAGAETTTDVTTDNQPVLSPATGSYKTCEGNYTRGCYSDAIKQVQTCLGLVSDGKFGPKTQAALEGAGFAGGFKDSDVDKICNVSSMPEPDLDLPTPDDEGIDLLNM
jgi:hypothetical protein